jgi:hypothetical protein
LEVNPIVDDILRHAHDPSSPGNRCTERTREWAFELLRTYGSKALTQFHCARMNHRSIRRKFIWTSDHLLFHHRFVATRKGRKANRNLNSMSRSFHAPIAMWSKILSRSMFKDIKVAECDNNGSKDDKGVVGLTSLIASGPVFKIILWAAFSVSHIKTAMSYKRVRIVSMTFGRLKNLRQVL